MLLFQGLSRLQSRVLAARRLGLLLLGVMLDATSWLLNPNPAWLFSSQAGNWLSTASTSLSLESSLFVSVLLIWAKLLRAGGSVGASSSSSESEQE
jgi:hypothetical protein